MIDWWSSAFKRNEWYRIVIVGILFVVILLAVYQVKSPYVGAKGLDDWVWMCLLFPLGCDKSIIKIWWMMNNKMRLNK